MSLLDMETKTNKINEALKSAGLLDKVKDIIKGLKFSEELASPVNPDPAAAPVAEPKKNEIKLTDGTSLIVEGDEIIEGAKVSKVTPEGSVDVTDGDYEEADTKTVYTVTGGVITKINPSVTEVEPANEMPAMMASLSEAVKNLNTRFDSLVAENTVLKTKLSEQVGLNKVAFEAIDAISKMPADEPIENPKKWDELTALEKHRARKA